MNFQDAATSQTWEDTLTKSQFITQQIQKNTTILSLKLLPFLMYY